MKGETCQGGKKQEMPHSISLLQCRWFGEAEALGGWKICKAGVI
jgi:hypothetical protein